MVRIATSIAVVTILAGTALAQGVYEEQFERSVSDLENLEARSEAILGDYIAAREELEEQYGREITDNERREIFEVLEERDPFLFTLFNQGIKQGAKAAAKKGAKEAAKGAAGNNQNLHVPINIDNLSGLPPSQRSLAEDEELFGRDYGEAELEARDYDDLEYEARDFEELAEREPFGFKVPSGVRHMAQKAAGRVFHKHGGAGGRRGGGGHRGGRHLRHAQSAMGDSEPQQEPVQKRSDAEDLFGREFDSELEAREFEEYLEERGLRSWLKAKLGNKKSQSPPAENSTSDDLVARDPGLIRWARNKFGGRRHGSAPAPQQSSDDQQYQRDFEDAEELEMREFDEELDAREFDEELDAREFDEELDAREFDEELDAREFDEELEAREFDEELEARDDMEELEMREFDEGLEDVLAREYEDFDNLD